MHAIVLATTCALAQPAQLEADASTEIAVVARSAQVGGLHRAAASLESALDVYRLALIELVPAARRIHEASKESTSAPAALLPAPAVEVFGRLADNLPSRIPAKELPVITRGYHVEVVDALGRLGAATTLGQVAWPLRRLVTGMYGVCGSADAIVDLYSRQRPVQMVVIDSEKMLADISASLDQVAAAERRIVRLKRQQASLGPMFQAFLRLELALGQALDLIAAAEEAGLHIGFEVQLATTGFTKMLDRVKAQLSALDVVLEKLEELPVEIPGTLAADLVVSADTEDVQARLAWEPPLGAPRAAAVRIYRRSNLEGIRDKLAARYRCEGMAADKAALAAESAAAELSDQAVLVSEESPGRSTFVEEWEELPIAPPVYWVVPVSPFGIEGKGVERVATFAPIGLAGATNVAARPLASEPDDPDFYSDLDTVEVTWELSPNDASGSPAQQRLAEEQTAATVATYRVIRIEGEGKARNIARVPAGQARYVDRPSLELLKSGVRYSVETLTKEDGAALPPDACALSEWVRRDLGPSLLLASGGIGSVRRPTQIERETAQRLADAATLESARTELVQKGDSTQVSQAWWSSVPVTSRRGWLESWSSLMTAGEKKETLAEPPATFCGRDLRLVRMEVWLATEPPEVRDEMDRWWHLMDGPAREEAVERYKKELDRGHREWILETKANQDGQVYWGGMRSVRMLAWWHSRDRSEKRELEAWWEGLDADRRLEGSRLWYQTLAEAEKRALHWPDWQNLTAEERDARLEIVPNDLPEELWRQMLVWRVWRRVVEEGGEPLAKILEQEVSAWDRLVTSVQYRLRPLDVALGFHLGLALLAVLAVVVGGAVLVRRARRRRRE